MTVHTSTFRMLTLALVLWLAHGGEAFGYGKNYYYNNIYTQRTLKKLSRRLFELEERVSRDAERLQVAEAVITDLARQSCRTGTMTIQNCPGFSEIPLNDVIRCVNGPVAGSPGVFETFQVSFDPPFMFPPVIDISIGSQAFVFGKNCSVEITTVSDNSFDFTYIADDLLPVLVELTWYACPSALFTGDQGLPLPLPPSSPSYPEPPQGGHGHQHGNHGYYPGSYAGPGSYSVDSSGEYDDDDK